MGLFSSKKVELPPTPTFFRDPYVGASSELLFNSGRGLLSPTVEGLPEILRATVSTNPEITRLVLEGLKAQLEPSYRAGRQNIINELEANNQLTGSTTASALGNFETDYLSQLTAAGAQAGIEDINRALENRIRLYGTGLNTINSAGSLGLSNQNAVNDFNLSNYENIVAKHLAEQKPQKGGLMGALTGGAGGLMAGLALAPFTGGSSLLMAGLGGGLGALAGGLGPQGTGGSFLQAGAGLYGSKLAMPNATMPVSSGGIYSGNGEAIFDVLKNSPNLRSKYPSLFGMGLN